MKHLVYIPNVNTPTLLSRALESICGYWADTIVIDSSEHGHTPTQPVEVIRPPSRLTFTQVQNWAQREAVRRGCDLLVFMHADAAAGPGVLTDAIVALREMLMAGRKVAGVFAGTDDALAVFYVPALLDVGPWDERIYWYYSDTDYYRRVRAKGYELPALGLAVEHERNGTFKASAVEREKAERRLSDDLRAYAGAIAGLP